jgi:DNA-binding MarR family transcriptional regulator
MQSSTPLLSTLREWMEIFMRRSMQDLVRFNRSRGISMSQYSTLLRLFHEGECGVSELGEQLGVTNAAASQLVDKLVQQSLLERCEDPADRRNKIISLSTSGRDLVLESMEARLNWLNELNDTFTPEQQIQIQAALSLLIKATGPAPQEDTSD